MTENPPCGVERGKGRQFIAEELSEFIGHTPTTVVAEIAHTVGGDGCR